MANRLGAKSGEGCGAMYGTLLMNIECILHIEGFYCFHTFSLMFCLMLDGI